MKKIAVIVIACLMFALFVPPLMAGQKKPYSKILVCTMIFDALGKIGDPSSVPLLTKGLNSQEFFIRAYAAQALGMVGDKTTVPLLLKLVDDKNYLVRVSAVKSLIKLGDSGMKAKLIEYLKSEDAAVRAAAVSHLGELDNATFVPVMQQLIQSEKDPVVRSKAVKQMAKSMEAFLASSPAAKGPAGEAVSPLVEAARRSLDDPNWQMRQAGCVALGGLEDKKSIPLLIERLGDESPYVRAAAKEALAKLGETSLIKFFWQDIDDKDILLKASSFLALAYLKDTTVIPVLLKESVAPGEEPLVRKVAVQALVMFEPELSQSLGASLAASHPDSGILADTFRVTYRISGRTLAEIYVKALADPGDPLHNDAPLVLRELNDPTVFPALREALATDDPDMVAACAFALGELHDTQATGILISTCKKYL
jgi:HEAT repeat protein